MDGNDVIHKQPHARHITNTNLSLNFIISSKFNSDGFANFYWHTQQSRPHLERVTIQLCRFQYEKLTMFHKLV